MFNWRTKGVVFFYHLQNKSRQHVHQILNRTFIFKKISNQLCHVETTKLFPFVKSILCPNFSMFANSPPTQIHILNFFIIKIKKSWFHNGLPNRRLITNQRSKTWNLTITINNNCRCMSIIIMVQLPYRISCIIMNMNIIRIKCNKQIRWNRRIKYNKRISYHILNFKGRFTNRLKCTTIQKGIKLFIKIEINVKVEQIPTFSFRI